MMHHAWWYISAISTFFISAAAYTPFEKIHDHHYCIILAGGHGQRLWPLTSPTMPKPLLSLDGTNTLLEQTMERVRPLVNAENMWLCVTQDYHDCFDKAVKSSITTFVTEPAARNTGPAVLYACFQLYRHDPDAIVFFLPADAYIPSYDYDLFRSYIEKGFAAAYTFPSSIIIFGQKPRFPSTGYGYIEVDYTSSYQAPYTVISFHEKPNSEVAQLYFKLDTMLWNTCMFCAPVRTFLEQYRMYAPVMVDAMEAYQEGIISYTDIMAEPIDRVVIEKSAQIKVIPMDICAEDVGTVESFLNIQKKYTDSHTLITLDASHVHACSQEKKIVGVIGLDDIYIVDTPSALLIMKKGMSEKIKHLLTRLSAQKK